MLSNWKTANGPFTLRKKRTLTSTTEDEGEREGGFNFEKKNRNSDAKKDNYVLLLLLF